MGCTKSGEQSLFLHNSIAVQNLSEANKEKLRDAIENDDMLRLAFTLQEIQGSPISQISQPKMGWMLSHLCCRWDSDDCLQFLLRLYFAQNPRGYIKLVNSQTAEGFTCLHLCGIWKSIKCFKVLYKFGGLDFSIKDIKLKTAYENALQYKCSHIAKVLKEYKDLNILFTKVQIQKLMDGPIITIKQEFPFQTETNYEIDIDSSAYLKFATSIFAPEGQKILIKQREQIEKQLQKRLKEKLQLSLGCDYKKAIMLLTLQVAELQKQQYLKVQKQKLHQQLKTQQLAIQSEIKEKQEQLKSINDNIKKLQQEKINNVKQEYEQEIQQKLPNIQAQLFQKLKQKYEFFQKNKENRSSKKFRQTSTFKKVGCNIQMTKKLAACPPQIIKMYQQAKKIGIFQDKQFPANNSSIGESTKLKYAQYTANCIWLRPRQIFRSDFQLFDGIDPDDIKQGSLGVCYMLATLSALAANPKNILNIFIFSDVQIGFYVLRLYVNGVPKYFIIDDLIPCSKITKSPLFTQPIGKQVWVLLLQKAWAKLIGSYLNAESMTADHMMEDLSGAPGYGWWLTSQNTKTPTEKIKEIVKHSQLGHIVVITSVADFKIEGIINNHAYSLLKVFNIGNRFIFKVRNPWGSFEWNGQFGQNSSLWTQQYKQIVCYDNKDDGIFFISENQLLKAFCYYSINHLKNDYYYSHISFQSKKYQDIYFRFALNKGGDVNIRVIQPFDRMTKDKDYKYSPLVFQVGKIEENNQITYISQGHQRTYFGAKSVHAFQDIFQNLQAGNYFIRIRMIWVNQQKYNNAVLACYAGQSVQFTKIDPTVGLNYLKSLFISFSKKFNRNRASSGFLKICTMKGQFVFVAQTQQQGQYEVDLKFIKQKMLKTQTDLGKVNQIRLSTKINKLNSGVMTAMRTDPAQGGTTGPVNILFTKL